MKIPKALNRRAKIVYSKKSKPFDIFILFLLYTILALLFQPFDIFILFLL
jgi:hypothetical protein